MKKNYLFVLLLISGSMAAQTINFPDNNFRVALLIWAYGYSEEEEEYFPIDVNGDGQIQFDEALELEYLDIDDASLNITDVTGIEYFTNLKTFIIENQNIPVINIPGPIGLEVLSSNSNHTTTLNLSSFPNLKTLSCANNELTSIDVSNNSALEFFSCPENLLTSLNVINLLNITSLTCHNNNITTLDVSGLSNLDILICHRNNLTSLTLTGLINLKTLLCSNNSLVNLDFTGLTGLRDVSCDNNKLTGFDLSFENNIVKLQLQNNTLTSIDLSGCTKLKNIVLDDNFLTSLDFSNCPFFAQLYGKNNLLEYINLKNGFSNNFINVDNNPNLTFVCVDDNEDSDNISYLNQTYPNCVVTSNCDLNKDDFILDNHITFYPNPASAILNIELTNDSNLKALEIYNIMGQRVLEIQNSANIDSIDISMLASGTYVLKTITDRGFAYTKFIKK